VTTKISKVGVQFEAKGAEAVDRQLTKTTGRLKTIAERGRDFAAMDKTVARLSKQFATMGAQLEKMNRSMGMAGGVQQMKEMQKATEAVTKAVEAMTQAKEKAHKTEKKHKEGREALSFHRGIAQGLEIGEYFPEESKAGFYRNLAGRGVGRMARGGVSAAATPFTGQEGFSEALRSIPGLGGWMAQKFGAAMQAAQMAVGVEQQKGGFAYLHGMGHGGRNAVAAAQAAAGVRIPGMNPAAITLAGNLAARDAGMLLPAGGKVQEPGPGRVRDRALARMDALKHGGLKELARVGAEQRAETAGLETPAEARERGEKTERAAQEKGIRNAKAAREAARRRAENADFNAPFGDMISAGIRFGLDPRQAIQAGSELVNTAGLNLEDVSKGRLTTAMAAQRRFGVGMGESGTMMRGERSGALGGSYESNLQGALETAHSMGLRGQDVSNYVRDIASKVQSFEQTGIPVARKSLGQLQLGLAQVVGGMRGQVLGQQLMGTVQNIGMNGPKDAAQMLAFRQMGGFSGGNINDYWAAQKKMAAGGDTEGLGRMLSAVQEGLDEPGAKSLAVKNLLGRLGVNINPGEADAFTGGDTSMLETWRGQMAAGGKAAGRVGGELAGAQATGTEQEVAASEAAKYASGEKVITAFLEFEKVSNQGIKDVAVFGKELGQMAGWAAKTSEEFTGILEKWKKITDDTLHKMGLAQ
jgi:hypothetical protein